MGAGAGGLDAYLQDARSRVLREIRDILPPDGPETGGLYGMMLDYPLRPAKALRPALCLAACRLFGGGLDAALPTAAALELYHNAFLIHDDVEDGSELRRGRPTLQREHGVPIAVNVGDGMLALALRPLVENPHHLGLAPALRILEAFAETARVSAEGQAMELAWIRTATWELPDRAYLRMVYKKSTHYSFVTPLTVGAICARAPTEAVRALQRYGAMVGIAFQIHDDVLNVEGTEAAYGKEIVGDLWEGKRTLLLLHALRTASSADRDRALAVLGVARGDRSPAEVAWLRGLLDTQGSIRYASDIATRHCERAARTLTSLTGGLPPSAHRDFLSALLTFVVRRDR